MQSTLSLSSFAKRAHITELVAVRVYTCTPVCFQGDYWFFTRESGLFSRGLKDLGIESISVMPGPAKPDDEDCLLRVPYEQLESQDFWGSLGLDGLILYNWAAPRYLKIARAVSTAGIPLLVNVDSCGLVSRPANPRLWRQYLLPYLFRKTNSPFEAARLVSQILDNCGIYRVARKRLATYEAATVACGVSPMATEWLQREALHFGKSHLVQKIRYLPHPQLPDFAYRGAPKEKLVLSVARWEKEDWIQKNPALLIKALDAFLAKFPDWRACIIGRGAEKLLSSLKIATVATDRLQFIDFLQPEDLIPYYNRASIACWSSRSEGQIGTGAQALCCGCSVVAGNAGTLSCFHHYVSRESGRLAIDMTADALAEALMLEADAWSQGQRDPTRISDIWSNEFHSNKVAARGLEMLGLPVPTT
jgi:glycosyltransferase involved in cell wall biosynthesis